MKGIDYAWANPKPSPSCLKSNDVGFIMRYFSYDRAKDLTHDELRAAINNGIAVGIVWETTANRMLGGYNAGVSDAKEADRRSKELGLIDMPLYFACDWDASEDEQATINSYMDGVISVIGKPRTGVYAGYWPGKRIMDVGKTTYLWQTYAWSGGLWDTRAQLRQVANGVTVCGTSADWDESMATDFGQFPRPIGETVPPIIQPEKEAEMISGMISEPRWWVAFPDNVGFTKVLLYRDSFSEPFTVHTAFLSTGGYSHSDHIIGEAKVYTFNFPHEGTRGISFTVPESALPLAYTVC